MGRPIIGSRIGGLTDIVVHDKTGLLVTPGDSLELQIAIQCLLNDPLSRERMGHHAREHMIALQAQAVVTQIEQVYQEVLES